jgi:hypothetical protein
MFRYRIGEDFDGSFYPGPIAYGPLPLHLRQAVNVQNNCEVHRGPQFVGRHPT